MENHEIKLPRVPDYIDLLSIREEMQNYAREAVRLNTPDQCTKDQARAWFAVCGALDAVAPGWMSQPHNGQDCAVMAIKRMGAIPQPKPEPAPFDLEAAKAGAPVLWGTTPARWVGTTDANKISSARNIIETAHGLAYATDADLFMAPKPKRTVYINANADGSGGVYPNEAAARKRAAERFSLPPYKAIAVPVEIDA